MARRRKNKPKLIESEPVIATVESMTHEGLGVVHVDGKTVFINDVLPGEKVEFTCVRSHRNYDEASLNNVIEASPHRIEPGCPHFGLCGGCVLQHVSASEQLKLKETILLDNFRHIGQVEPEVVLPPLTGPEWGYRRKARLGVRYVNKKERVLVGFRERSSRYLADIQTCKVLHPSVGEDLTELASIIRELSIYTRIPQVEVAVGDNATALVIRHLEPLTEEDRQKLTGYARQHGYQMYLQPKGPDTVNLLYPDQAELFYRIEDYDLTLNFLPSDFTQVNQDINSAMIGRALELLNLDTNDRVLELFCGLGNFTLPIAKAAKQVVAVEGEIGLIQRAKDNADLNQVTNVEYHVANLMEDITGLPWTRKQHYDKVFLDPPRSGAKEILPFVAKTGASVIVYVSCHPATLARDAGELVNNYGYKLKAAGVMDMFPHTAHVESIALFEKS
ncbi:MAG: 23S rRNA (uracil(1939)-C(5))-methyltransferase RlmD [Gammaproteobacteria bacterium]|nr:23S rRNA (uracil(1939)-C(5))-methyltransferase RlmD [Gammaproteobacteria bacterium]